MAVKPAQVMVIIPHPDDAEFGVAGTVARWSREGKDIVYVLCTNGDKGTNDPSIKPEELVKIREAEQLAAAKILGVREVIFLRHPDQSLEDTPEFREEITRLIRMYQPETVLCNDPNRRYLSHRDHRITGQVVLDAVFLYARNLYAFPALVEEGLQPFKVKEVLLWGTEDQNYRSDITETFDLKLAALRCHQSQLGDRPQSDFLERMKERHRTAAEGESYALAEAFHRLETSR